MFADLQKAGIAGFDFIPKYREIVDREGTVQYRKKMSFRKYARSFMKKIIGGDRLKIGQSRDTASNIFTKWGNEPAECVLPVFRGDTGLMDKFLPDRFSFIPKKAGYFSTESFKDKGYFDALGSGWEEYMWRGKPFGIHLRKNRWPQEEIDRRIQNISKILDTLIV